jgi:signal transduction histidine kinase
MSAGFARRATLALGLLLLGFGLFVALLVHYVGQRHDEESQQRLARGLAQHIVEHWPTVSAGARTWAPAAGEPGEPTDAEARQELLRMLMTVNPAIRVYLLDADGTVAHYIGEPGMVRSPQVDLSSVRSFLAGAPAPLRGTDPMGGPPRAFSAAMFPPQPGQTRPPGYLYVVLGEVAAPGQALPPAWRSAGWALGLGLGLGLMATLLAGALVMGRLTVPLNRLARRMAAFQLPGHGDERAAPPPGVARDEVSAIGQAFDALAERVLQQARHREVQTAAHREVMAGVAHDLRTPLTALHGHLEALQARPRLATRCQPHLGAALSQSDKLRRLTQHLFELATLQATQELAQRERFRLDELVSDTVLKFHPGPHGVGVALLQPPAEAVVVDGDLHLIERALSNLIDNAVRHAGATLPVQVSLHRDGGEARVLVEDHGPGLSPDLARQLDAGLPVRDLLALRPGHPVGGLGLAITQRIAQLHGGSLRTLPGEGRGARLVLHLPLPRPPDSSAVSAVSTPTPAPAASRPEPAYDAGVNRPAGAVARRLAGPRLPYTKEHCP